MNKENKITLKETFKVLVKNETMMKYGYKLMAKRLFLSIIIPAFLFIKVILKLIFGIINIFFGNNKDRERRKIREDNDKRAKEFNRQMDSIKDAIYYKNW